MENGTWTRKQGWNGTRFKPLHFWTTSNVQYLKYTVSLPLHFWTTSKVPYLKYTISLPLHFWTTSKVQYLKYKNSFHVSEYGSVDH
jgi:hypothetical protein